MIPFRKNQSERRDIFAHSHDRMSLGNYGERLAAEFLLNRNYRLVAANFIAPIGHSSNGRQITGEVDIIAYDESAPPHTLAFIEVKTRTTIEIARPETAVDLRKQRHIIKSAQVYRRIMGLYTEAYRYDVVAIFLPPDRHPEIDLFKGFFSEQRFHHSHWLATPQSNF